jgi:NADP-dependent 3-hydroxy acid dehydrogenase YdfG
MPDLVMPASAVADAIIWAIDQPEGVDVNTLVVRPVGQTI